MSSLYLSAAASGIVAASFARKTGRRVRLSERYRSMHCSHKLARSAALSRRAREPVLSRLQQRCHAEPLGCVQLPMLISGIAFIAGAAIMAAAVDVAMLVVGRVVLGVGLGLACVIVPMVRCRHRCQLAAYLTPERLLADPSCA